MDKNAPHSPQPLLRALAIPLSMAAFSLTIAAFSSVVAAQQSDRVLTVVLSEEPDNIDGCNANRSSTGRVVRNNVVEAMAEIDAKDGTVMPRLAESWERVNDLTWRFKLREGVNFHDGAPLNAETAVKGMARTMNPNTDCETRTRNFGTIKFEAKAVDSHVVEIVTDKPVPILPTYMSTLMLVSPNQPMEQLADPVGTGPYQFVNWIAGQEINLKRFDGWWGEKPEAAGVRYVWRTESSIRAAMVATGEADIAPNIGLNDATDPSLDFSYLNSETSSLRIDATIPPLDDRRVRLALNLAVDREALRGSIFPKEVIPATQDVVPSILGHNHELDKKVWPYDPERAKQLLSEAQADGVPVDREITMWGRIGLYPNAQEVMEAFLNWYQAIGLNVKVKMLEVGEWRRLNVKPFAQDRPANLMQTQHDNSLGDAVFSVFFRYACDGSVSGYCDPQLDKKIVHAATLTGEERVKSWNEVFRIIHEDAVAIVPMFHMVGYARVGTRITYRPTLATNSEIQISQITFK